MSKIAELFYTYLLIDADSAITGDTISADFKYTAINRSLLRFLHNWESAAELYITNLYYEEYIVTLEINRKTKEITYKLLCDLTRDYTTENELLDAITAIFRGFTVYKSIVWINSNYGVG